MAEGSRGGRWVLAQFALMLLVALAGFLPPGWGPLSALAAVGAMLSLLGLLLAAWSWISLERAATAYPHPKEGGRLIERGPYAYLRHPMYTAGISFFLGYALATSPAALEEELLEARYPDYRDYRARVRGSFVPRP